MQELQVLVLVALWALLRVVGLVIKDVRKGGSLTIRVGGKEAVCIERKKVTDIRPTPQGKGATAATDE